MEGITLLIVLIDSSSAWCRLFMKLFIISVSVNLAFFLFLFFLTYSAPSASVFFTATFD